ncbi:MULTISPECIES: PH domain-containing protein [unclassified Flavobacterium]|uniref:PH domain-containing protein n=1 Tax=unclassified Flavobacterium TaxID=196869 RepID=UPI0012910421|nr:MULTISPECIES: PH domain-containing protein [unclassified Flavobacterium]MQP52355.1 PH domain-containing protein [Flavobacterium sp. LMO9]MQP62425.1 PH domain-containing protein [Flavobacterium sp. LMO6]
MNNFSNNTIDLDTLPKFEELHLNALHSNYVKVLLFNFLLLVVLAIGGFTTVFFVEREVFSTKYWLLIFSALVLFLVAVIVIAKLSFNKKGYAFREHDAIYKSGLISETTTIIPFNRVQHVALHQGFIARRLGLASIELFTAGGSSSDLEIPGLLLEEAQKIKNMVSHKINPIDKLEETEVIENSLPENLTAESNE